MAVHAAGFQEKHTRTKMSCNHNTAPALSRPLRTWDVEWGRAYLCSVELGALPMLR